MGLGAVVAVICAFTWSVSVILFKKCGDDLHPLLLNLLKNSLAFVLMIPTIYFAEASFAPSVTTQDLVVLLLSGLLGIGIADAMMLKALNMIGASRIAIVECAYSPCVIILSMLFLGEALTLPRVMGAALVAVAILCVNVTRSGAIPNPKLVRGTLLGIAAMVCMATGIVLVKPIFDRVPLFWIIGVRLGAGMLGSAVIFQVLCDRKREFAMLKAAPRKGLVFIACFISTYVSMILWVSGYKFNDAMITAVLNQTSTFFTVILATVFLHERFTPLKALGTALAFGGVMIMTFA